MKLSTFTKHLCIALIALTLCNSCTEDYSDVLPQNGNIANVTFDCLIEVIKQNYGSSANLELGLTNPHYIYINDSIPNETFPGYPRFMGAPEQDLFRYPGAPVITGDNPDLGYADENGRYDRVFWMPLATDTYKFIFTNGFKNFLTDTTVTLTKGTHTQFYLVEDPERDFAYTTVCVPWKRHASKDSVSIQLVHLSPDTGEVAIFQTDKNGNEIPTQLPQAVGFGKTLASTNIAIQGAHETDDLILFKIRSTATGEILQSVAVPALSGAAFTVVFHGFSNEATRWYRLKGDDYRSITIAPNLRVKLRRTS